MSVQCPYGFSLSFQKDNGQSLAVVESKSEHYLVGEEGQAFQVAVTAPPSPLPVNEYWSVVLYVDGQFVQNPLMKPSERRVVEGWLVGESQVRPMVFGKPPLVQDRSLANPEAGQIKVTISRAVYSHSTVGNFIDPKSSSAFAGDKFWKQGGLTAQPGSVRQSRRLSFMQTVPLPQFPLETVTLSYSTPMYLMLRNVLQRDNPDHAAFFPQDEKEEEDEAEVIDVDEIYEREARLKRQRENEKWEVACDLTSDEPSWSKKPRPRPAGEPLDLDQIADSDSTSDNLAGEGGGGGEEEEAEEEAVVKGERS